MKLLAAVILALAVAVNGAAVERPCICTMEYSPVCGSDGNSYGNECTFNCQAAKVKQTPGAEELFLVKREACDEAVAMNRAAVEKPCICTKEFKPVCGSDGNSYNNECSFNCQAAKVKQTPGAEELFLVKREACDVAINRAAIRDGCMCTMLYMPVCGSDGNSYSNECIFNCQAAKVKQTPGAEELFLVKREACDVAVSRAAVEKPCLCTKEFRPVCGSDGNSYSNECSFNCQAAKVKQTPGAEELFLVKREACDVAVSRAAAVEKPCFCTKEFRPVCGSDGNSYNNECSFNCQAAKVKQTPGAEELFLVKREACDVAMSRAAVRNPCICTMEYRPVCGSDGVSYGNECTFNCQAAIVKQNPDNEELFLVKREEC